MSFLEVKRGRHRCKSGQKSELDLEIQSTLEVLITGLLLLIDDLHEPVIDDLDKVRLVELNFRLVHMSTLSLVLPEGV